MHRKPTLWSALKTAAAEHLIQKLRRTEEDKEAGRTGKRVFCELVALSMLSVAAGMVALPLGIAAGGLSFFALSRMV